MKLISMTEKVLQLSKDLGIGGDTFHDFYLKTTYYANFLSQPLTLGMFVPCVDGVPLEEPIKNQEKYYNENKNRYYNDLETYNKAKENVLFEGFEYKSHSKGCFVLECKYETYWLYPNDTVEQIIDIFTEPLTLTESAKQQLKQ